MWPHLQSLVKGCPTRKLYKLLLEIFPKHSDTSHYLHGCWGCDGLHQASSSTLCVVLADIQILRALVFMQRNADSKHFWTSHKLNRASVEDDIRQFVHDRLSLTDMYRIIAQYQPSTQMNRHITNQQYTFDEYLNEAKVRTENDLKKDPKLPESWVFDGNGNYPSRFKKRALPPQKSSRIASYMGGDLGDCFALTARLSSGKIGNTSTFSLLCER